MLALLFWTSQPRITVFIIYFSLTFLTFYLLLHHLTLILFHVLPTSFQTRSLTLSKPKATPARTVLTLSKLHGINWLKVNKQPWVIEEAFMVVTKDAGVLLYCHHSQGCGNTHTHTQFLSIKVHCPFRELLLYVGGVTPLLYFKSFISQSFWEKHNLNHDEDISPVD